MITNGLRPIARARGSAGGGFQRGGGEFHRDYIIGEG